MTPMWPFLIREENDVVRIDIEDDNSRMPNGICR